MNKISKTKISGIGCIICDYLYEKVNFNGDKIKPFLIKQEGDGGMNPG